VGRSGTCVLPDVVCEVVLVVPSESGSISVFDADDDDAEVLVDTTKIVGTVEGGAVIETADDSAAL